MSNQLAILAGQAVIYEGWVDERGEYHRGLPGPDQRTEVRCGQGVQDHGAADQRVQLLKLKAAELKRIQQLQPAPVLSRLMQAAQITTLRLEATQERQLWAAIDRAMDGHTAEDTALVAGLLGTGELQKIDGVLADMKAPF